MALSAEQKRLKQEIFLEAFAREGTDNAGREPARLDWGTLQKWKSEDAEFCARYKEALLTFTRSRKRRKRTGPSMLRGALPGASGARRFGAGLGSAGGEVLPQEEPADEYWERLHREAREWRETGGGRPRGAARTGEGQQGDRPVAPTTEGEKTEVVRYREEPGLFFSEVLGWRPWARQVEIAEAVRDAIVGKGPRRVAVRSGNGVGKTALAARVMLWVLRCWPNSVVITTAPTSRQVDQLLWREARMACYRALKPLGGRFYEGKALWELADDNFALGLSPEHTQPERFHGFHADLIVFIADEASGVPEAHWEAIKGSALAGNAVILAIGNPTRLHGEFYEAFHGHAELWRRLHISAFDLPNLAPETDPDGPPPIPGLVTKKGVEEARLEWGEASSLWQVRILGEFPAQEANGLLELEWIEEATRVERLGDEASLGVDVARSGQDETVLCLMLGNRVEKIAAWRGQDTMKTAGAVKVHALDYPGFSIAVDDGGVGGGVVDRLREMDVAVRAVKFGGSPEGPNRVHYKNRLAELYWQLREAMRERRMGIPNDSRLLAQLTRLEWEHESDARIRVYKRGMDNAGESPDRADALALAWEAHGQRGRHVGVWLPPEEETSPCDSFSREDRE